MSGIAHVLIPAAVVLDYFAGDPHGLPHPVRLVGAVIDRLERLARRQRLVSLRTFGMLAVLGLAGTAWLVVDALCALPGVGWLLVLYFAYAGLALGCLLREGREVIRLLDLGDLPGARDAVAGLVSRDAAALDEAGVRRALAETLAENLNDGFSAPLFWLAFLGPEGLWAYKVVSTFDSMWGYRTEECRDLGRFGARLDDVLAYVPARLTAAALLLAGKFLGLHPVRWNDVAADARKMDSPNAGWPMAAAAWLLEARMGGPTVYFGSVKDKPALGPEGEWSGERLARLPRLLTVSSVILVVALQLAAAAI